MCRCKTRWRAAQKGLPPAHCAAEGATAAVAIPFYLREFFWIPAGEIASRSDAPMRLGGSDCTTAHSAIRIVTFKNPPIRSTAAAAA
jgi:hypothetical protein